MGTITGKAKLTQSHNEWGLILSYADKKGWRNELIIGVGSTNALTRNELDFEYGDAVNLFEFRESRISYQAFTQYNLGYRNESGEIAWMNRFGRAWQYQKEFEPNVRELNDDGRSPYDFYSTGIRIGTGKAQWHIYAQFERIFLLESTFMCWKKNQFSIGVVIRPIHQCSPTTSQE